MSVIYNGVEQYSQIIHSPKVLPHKPFIFTIGSITRKKNFHTLLPLLVDRDMILVLAGHLVEKDYQKFIIHVAEKLKVEHQIIWVGGISENDKSWYYKNCYAFAFPSLAEGFGLPVIEAMHYGKPCFISNKTSLPEIGGDCAFYFECFEPVYMNQIFDKKNEVLPR